MDQSSRIPPRPPYELVVSIVATMLMVVLFSMLGYKVYNIDHGRRRDQPQGRDQQVLPTNIQGRHALREVSNSRQGMLPNTISYAHAHNHLDAAMMALHIYTGHVGHDRHLLTRPVQDHDVLGFVHLLRPCTISAMKAYLQDYMESQGHIVVPAPVLQVPQLAHLRDDPECNAEQLPGPWTSIPGNPTIPRINDIASRRATPPPPYSPSNLRNVSYPSSSSVDEDGLRHAFN
ncbi:hypothetical protein M011DRAFT_172175 [Sporormia fimetaria CBS 119925]|uniref:Uncharacterized protein n=1 Tax=Sporormia fimetaria CBS 119925 TaxID=1340428 RepID=A0A6A6V3G8_9PLEO|nr:hypothetical protein M011DRAFT_172175 [Sporormia fimetaria CBS 119925]